MTHTLGIEFGSTRIKAVLIDEAFRPVASGDYTWKSDLRDGVWTYDLEEAWSGLRTALRALGEVSVDAMGISAMMHGYLAFDKDWNLLTPFRTWQNTMTGEEAAELTELFDRASLACHPHRRGACRQACAHHDAGGIFPLYAHRCQRRRHRRGLRYVPHRQRNAGL